MSGLRLHFLLNCRDRIMQTLASHTRTMSDADFFLSLLKLVIWLLNPIISLSEMASGRPAAGSCRGTSGTSLSSLRRLKETRCKKLEERRFFFCDDLLHIIQHRVTNKSRQTHQYSSITSYDVNQGSDINHGTSKLTYQSQNLLAHISNHSFISSHGNHGFHINQSRFRHGSHINYCNHDSCNYKHVRPQQTITSSAQGVQGTHLMENFFPGLVSVRGTVSSVTHKSLMSIFSGTSPRLQGSSKLKGSSSTSDSLPDDSEEDSNLGGNNS